MSEHTIIEGLCIRSRDVAKEKGWLAEDGTDPRSFPTAILLYHSELSEAAEEYRNHKPVGEIYYEVKFGAVDGNCYANANCYATCAMNRTEMISSRERMEKYCGNDIPQDKFEAKPAGIPIELADFIIRICQRVGANGTPRLLQSYINGFHWSRHAKPDWAEDPEKFLASLHKLTSIMLIEYESKNDENHPLILDTAAEAISRTFFFCHLYDVDLWAAIDEKEAFNRTRPVRHGGKKI